MISQSNFASRDGNNSLKLIFKTSIPKSPVVNQKKEEEIFEMHLDVKSLCLAIVNIYQKRLLLKTKISS